MSEIWGHRSLLRKNAPNGLGRLVHRFGAQLSPAPMPLQVMEQGSNNQVGRGRKISAEHVGGNYISRADWRQEVSEAFGQGVLSK